MTTYQPPVIVIPGITATGLEDFYPIPPDEVWSAVLNKNYDRISMHPDNIRFEAMEPARVQAHQPFGLIYADLVHALRHDLATRHDRPTPVFLFSYDWRQECGRVADQLDGFIEEVIARTLLLPHYRGRDGKPISNLRVDLVAHSMGGLIIADYLARFSERASKCVRRVVTIGTPFRGAVDALTKLTTGMGSFTEEPPRDRERESARTMPSLYQLLPTYAGAIVPDQGMPDDIFSAGTWQPSVVQTLQEYIRQRQARIDAGELLATYLSTAREFRARVDKINPATILPEHLDGWLAIVGVGAPTRLSARVIKYRGNPWFDIPDPIDEWSNDHVRAETGDGTVPFAGACPTFLEKERLVCVSPEEFGFMEIRDRMLAKVAGFHGALPTVNLVQKLTIRFLRPRFDTDLSARRAPGIKQPIWPKWIKATVKDE